MDSNETNNLQFKRVKIKFYPEDIARMEKMSLEEKIEYKQKLKAENKYIREDDSFNM